MSFVFHGLANLSPVLGGYGTVVNVGHLKGIAFAFFSHVASYHFITYPMPSFELLLTLSVVFFTITTLILLLLPKAYGGKDDTHGKDGEASPRFQILVLGDIGRSPRMQYHAISIAKHGGLVDLIGYQGWLTYFTPQRS